MRVLIFLIAVILVIFLVSYYIFFGRVYPSEEQGKGILCNPCEIGNCICNIKFCEKGNANIYNNSNCAGIPLFAISFSSNKLEWNSEKKGIYYIKLLCDDKEFSICLPITVS